MNYAELRQFITTGVLNREGIVISMDGRGRAFDNIFVERLWRNVKYEDVYLKGYATMDELMIGLAAYFTFYNFERPHQALNHKTPAAAYQSAIGGGALIVDKFGGTAQPTSVSLCDGATDATTEATTEARSESTAKTTPKAKPGQRRPAANEVERVT